jgi:hypothetical protein
MSWAELRARLTKNWSAVWSGNDSLNANAGFDESYIRYETDKGSIRAGRLRTSFGFSDWSELFYTGFNHKPLVREMRIVGTSTLDRDDSGAEVTANFGALQVQASVLDIATGKQQFTPNRADHGTITGQYSIGNWTLGLVALDKNDGSEKVYGGNFRYTLPHWIFKGEAFEGVGPNSGTGAYIDATYRIPSLPRTQLVARYEQVRVAGSDAPTTLNTLGIRHVFNQYLTANLNYGWGKELDYSPYASNLGLDGWTARLLFQVHF